MITQARDDSSVKQIGIDTETNGKDVRDGRGYAMGVSLAYESRGNTYAMYLPFRHSNILRVPNYNRERFLPILQDIIRNKLLVYFNAKFDLESLSTLGLDTQRGDFLDVLILCHLINENRPFEKSLENCSQMYLGVGKEKNDLFDKLFKMYGWEGMPPEGHAEYASVDALRALQLLHKIQPMLAEEKLGETWERKARMIQLLRAMEHNGIGIDTELCDRMAEYGRARMWELSQELGLNPGSPKDLEKLLIDELGLPEIKAKRKRKDGTVEFTRTFNAEAMKQYEEVLTFMNNPTAKLILEYRGWQKSVSSNYEAYVTLMSPDGRLRPNYKLHGTVTGRLACEQPNLQQIPRSGAKPWNGSMKKCFVARPGYTLVECDYSQLEFRLNAAYGEQQDLIEKFADPNVDIFDEIRGELGWERQPTKGFVYSTAYGAGPPRISTVFGVTELEAKGLIDDFYNRYPGLRTANNYAKHLCLHEGKLQIWSGRYRHFMYPKSEAHKALNSVIQGGAADIVEAAMLKLQDAGFNDCERSFMLLQVHDSVACEIRNDCLDEMVPQMQNIMADVDYPFGVVFKAEAKIWGK